MRCSCLSEDSFDLQLASPKHPTHFQWGLDLENALAIRDVEYPRCLDNVLNSECSMTVALSSIKTNLSPTAPREKTNMREVELPQWRAAIDHDAGPHHDTVCRVSVLSWIVFGR
ncbi:hypothetical protein TNCV_557811 [Trichonephila clavipes]|nr:hypothetical protein TNCV_557811 [Trichonephila clavipes]